MICLIVLMGVVGPTADLMIKEERAAAYERRALDIGSHWPFDPWGRFLPKHTTAVSLLDRLLHHSTVVVTEGESLGCDRPAPEAQHASPRSSRLRRPGDFNMATSGHMH